MNCCRSWAAKGLLIQVVTSAVRADSGRLGDDSRPADLRVH
jgi:hypothetical protein